MAEFGTFTAGQVLTAAELNAAGAWTTFTPTWTNLTVGNATQSFRYTIFNKIMFVNGTLTFGSTTVMGTDPRFTIPASKTAVNESWVLTRLLDSAADNYYATAVASGTFIYLYRLSDSGVDDPRLRGITATVPFTWAVNDGIWVNVQFPIS